MLFLTHNDLRLNRRPIFIDRLPAAFDGFTIAQISDLHFYEYTSAAYYQRVTDVLNALNPDIIAMTGDVVHYGPDFVETAGRFLSRLRAKEGRFAILGNHDYHDGGHGANITRMLEESGFQLLKNEPVRFKRQHEGQSSNLWLAGLDDLWYGFPDLDQTLNAVPTQTDTTVVLSHNPLMFDPVARSARHRVDLVLSGHTHAGHVYIPMLGPIYRRIFRMKYRYGLYRKKHCQLYVTSGVGSAAFYLKKRRLGFPRFRFNTRPEIAVLELRRPEKPR